MSECMILLDIKVARPRLQHFTHAHIHALKTSFSKEFGAGEFPFITLLVRNVFPQSSSSPSCKRNKAWSGRRKVMGRREGVGVERENFQIKRKKRDKK